MNLDTQWFINVLITLLTVAGVTSISKFISRVIRRKSRIYNLEEKVEELTEKVWQHQREIDQGRTDLDMIDFLAFAIKKGEALVAKNQSIEATEVLKEWKEKRERA